MRIKLFLALVGLSCLISCSEREIYLSPLPEHGVYATMDSVSDEGQTKVYVGEDRKFYWNESDRISVFYNNVENQEYRFTGQTGDNYGGFEPADASGLSGHSVFESIYAVYPYSPDAAISNNGTITLSLPQTQTYAVKSFGLGANTMISKSESPDLIFRNIGGALILKLYGTGIVSSITLEGNAGEKLAGNASVIVEDNGYPAITLADDASGSITLLCDPPVEYGHLANEYEEFWFYLPPVSLSSGIKVTIKGPDGGEFTKSTSNPVVIKRGKITRMAPIQVNVQDVCLEPPSNQIWYTTINGSILTPKKTDVFGANLVSNTYVGGMGVMTFDSDVTMVGARPEGYFSRSTDAPFNKCWTLYAVALPKSVRTIGPYAFYGCSNLVQALLPDRLDYLGGEAFESTKLSSIYIPETESLDGNPFRSVSTLQEISGPYATSDGRGLIKNGRLHCVAPYGITEWTVPQEVRIIGSYAFYGCDKLEKITLPEYLTEVGNGAFMACSSLQDIVLPSSLTSMASSAFYRCQALRKMNIPQGVRELNDWFDGCTSMEEFSGKFASPDGRLLVARNSVYAFAPAGLKEYSIPDGVEKLCYGFNTYGMNALANLERLILPKSVVFINLRGATLKNVTCLNENPPEVAYESAYYFNVPLASIFVPSSALEAYKSDKIWGNYADVTYPYDLDGHVFDVSPSEVSLSEGAGTFEVKVVSDVEYHADIVDSWISESSVSGDVLNGRVHTYSIKANKTSSERQGIIVLCSNNGTCVPVLVNQAASTGSYDWVSKEFKHRSLGMRFTATWCQWCPYMNESFIKARATLGDRFEYVSLHAPNSTLAFSGTSTLASQYKVTGYPTGIIDGLSRIGNASDTDLVRDRIVTAVQATENTYPTTVALGVNSSLSDRNLKIDVDVYPKLGEEYKITVFLLESGVVAYQTNGGDNYVHDKIARMALTSPGGDSFTTESGEIKKLSYSTDIPDGYNINNMTILVYIQRQFGSQTNIQSDKYGDYYVDNCRVVQLGVKVDPEFY